MPIVVKAIVLLFMGFYIGNCTHKQINSKVSEKIVVVDPSLYKKVDFIDNSKSTNPFLALNVNFEPLFKIRKQIEKLENIKLLHRGEAHITVLTPSELANIGSVLSFDLIDEVARLHRIQEIPFEIVCVGRGKITQDQKNLATYFLVVDTPELMRLRNTIRTLFVTRGGLVDSFHPEDYHPHITIGFTERDLYQQDGVLKNKTSCFSNVQLKGQ